MAAFENRTTTFMFKFSLIRVRVQIRRGRPPKTISTEREGATKRNGLKQEEMGSGRRDRERGVVLTGGARRWRRLE
jgi:hypothetical protein